MFVQAATIMKPGVAVEHTILERSTAMKDMNFIAIEEGTYEQTINPARFSSILIEKPAWQLHGTETEANFTYSLTPA